MNLGLFVYKANILTFSQCKIEKVCMDQDSVQSTDEFSHLNLPNSISRNLSQMTHRRIKTQTMEQLDKRTFDPYWSTPKQLTVQKPKKLHNFTLCKQDKEKFTEKRLSKNFEVFGYEPILYNMDESMNETIILPDDNEKDIGNLNLSSILARIDSTNFINANLKNDK